MNEKLLTKKKIYLLEIYNPYVDRFPSKIIGNAKLKSIKSVLK